MSHTSHRKVFILPCQALKRIPSCSLQQKRSPDITEQTRVLKGHIHRKSRVYTTFQLQLEKKHETFPYPQMRPDSAAMLAEQFLFHIKQERSLDFLDGTPESPQEYCHTSRGILMSPQQHERAPCTPNQLNMRRDSLALTQEECQLSTSTSRRLFSQL